MNKILIGSSAIKNHFPDFPREPKDLDYAVDIEAKSGQRGLEYLYNPILFEDPSWSVDGVISKNALFTLKFSHLRHDINWDKHMWDFQWLLARGCIIEIELYNKLVPFWEEYLPKVRRSNLMQSKEEFFTNAVNEDTNQHDYLHTLIADVPAYTKILKDGSEVEPDLLKWVLAPKDVKDAVIREEAYIMGYERMPDLYYKIAYKRQLKANIIKHYPSFVAEYAIMHYQELLKVPFNFIEIINKKLCQNKVLA